MFNNGAQFVGLTPQFFKKFFPCEMGNFRLFQEARREVIVNYTNCNLLEHEWIRTGIRRLEAQIDEKNKNIEVDKILLVRTKKSVVCCTANQANQYSEITGILSATSN